MHVTLPNGAESYPEDYDQFLVGLNEAVRFPQALLFPAPQDPGTALGRQGNENFVYSVLIGTRSDGLFLILKYDSKNAYGPKSWSYCIVNGAEWNEVVSFSTLAELIHYLETER